MPFIEYDASDGVAHVGLNRHEVSNAIDLDTAPRHWLSWPPQCGRTGSAKGRFDA